MKFSSFIVFLLLMSGCSGDDAGKIGVDFVYDIQHLNRSPEVYLEGVPEEVNYLVVEFFDATNNWEHGSGKLPYDGAGMLPAGALKEFKGLSSVWGLPKIRLTVTAYNKDGKYLAEGTITKKPPGR